MKSKMTTLLILAGAFAMPLVGHAAEGAVHRAASNAGESIDDASITTQIKAKFAVDKTVSAMSITVDTDNGGMVTLSGEAKSKTESNRAASLARHIKGVKSVKNDIVVTGAKESTTSKIGTAIDDAAITTMIKAKYAKDKTVSAMNISVDTDKEGMVTLSGEAKSKVESDKAASIARHTKGVKSVKNDIVVGTK